MTEEEPPPSTPAELGLPELNISNPAYYVKPPEWAVPANVRFGFKVFNHRSKEIVEWLPFEKNIIHVAGSDPALSHFYVGHPTVEPQHACIMWHKTQVCCVSDTMSEHGTYVNDMLIGHEVRHLTPGDSIRFGKSVHIYELNALPKDMVPVQFRETEPHAYMDSPSRPPADRMHSPHSAGNSQGGPDFRNKRHNFITERRMPTPNSPGPGSRTPNNRPGTPVRDRRRSQSPGRHRHGGNNSASPQMNRHRNNRSPHSNERHHQRDGGGGHNDWGGPPGDRHPQGRGRRQDFQGPPHGDNRHSDFHGGGRGNSPFRGDRPHGRDNRDDRNFPDRGRDFNGPHRGHQNDQDRGFQPRHDSDGRFEDGPPRHGFREGRPRGGGSRDNRGHYDNRR